MAKTAPAQPPYFTPTTDPDLHAIYQQLADRFVADFPTQRPGARTVGREGEFPVVGAQGEAVDVRRLWNVLLEQDDLTPEYGPGAPGKPDFIVGMQGREYSYALEVGLGTVEINTRPCRHLFEVQAIMERAVARLVHAAARFGWRVLGYGIQPVSPPSIGLMSPKQRYLSLYRAMGNPWLWYTVTASDQLHVAIRRDETLHMLNYGNLVVPVIIALCANSPIYGGKVSPFCSAREGVMAEIRANEHRHGMPPRAFASLLDFVETASQSTYLIVRDEGEILPSSRPFYEFLRERGPDYPAYLFHDHYIWNSARLRATFGTIEVRPACQQPWGEHMAVAALILGLIEGSDAILGYLQDALGEEYWARMKNYHAQAIRHGLHAPQPAPNLLNEVVTRAQRALVERHFGEEKLLAPIWARLERGLDPAEVARMVYRADGMQGMLMRAAIRL